MALGREACRKGFKARFFTAAGLVTTYLEAREESRVLKLEAAISRLHLVIVDIQGDSYRFRESLKAKEGGDPQAQ